jgi:hypothetical protein
MFEANEVVPASTERQAPVEITDANGRIRILHHELIAAFPSVAVSLFEAGSL